MVMPASPGSRNGPQAAVDEPDHPVEAVFGVSAPLEAVGGLQRGEAVDRAADGPDGVVHLVVADAVSAQHGRDGGQDAGARRQQRVGGAGELGTDRGGVAAGVGGHVGPGRGEQGPERVDPRAALQGVAHGVAQLGHGQGGDAVLQIGQAIDVLVQGGRAYAEAPGEQAHRQLLVANLIDQAGGGGDNVVAGQPRSRQGRVRSGTGSRARPPRPGTARGGSARRRPPSRRWPARPGWRRRSRRPRPGGRRSRDPPCP